MLCLCSVILSAQGQSYLSPKKDYKVQNLFPSYSTFSAYDVNDSLLYANDGDTIRCFNLKTGMLLNVKYGKPAGYSSWPSFITVSPNGKRIWAGFTVSGDTDDRIYVIDLKTGTWSLKAKLAGNFDLEFLNGKVLVSGLNSSDWSTPNSIYLLDTTGTDNHKKIIEIGGNSAGFATDANGNVYYGTYLMYATPPKPDGLYKWNSDKVSAAISGTTYLTLDDGVFLSKLPNGAYDCEVDAGGNLFFNSNNFSSPGFIGKWNGTTGDAFNYDTIATTPNSDWVTFLKTTGNVLKPEKGGKLFALAFAQPIAEVQHKQPPVKKKKIGNINALLTDLNITIALSSHFTNADDINSLSYEVALNTNSAVALASIDNKNLVIDFTALGQTKLVVKATAFGLSAADTFYVGVHPVINGNYVVSNFEDLTLAPNSYWNGSDSKGHFDSGIGRFINNYTAAWGSWDGFAYSNMADDSTAGMVNQYSSITGRGIDPSLSSGSNYGLGYVPIDWMTSKTIPITMTFSDTAAHQVKGFYVTNSTYTALSMERGDFFAKKFGGNSGNDPDWYKLSVWGVKNGNATDTVHFYLADYRNADNSKDYIIKTWQWVDLSSLGRVDSLKFIVNSSDVGMYGMNTPGYFCMDNLFVVPDNPPTVANPIADVTVSENAQNYTIDLSNVFTDSDNDVIVKTVESNSNTGLVTASIVDNTLTLAFTANHNGVADIVIKGKSGKLSVTDAFKVTVTPNTGIHQIGNSPVTIYPNPSNGTFRIATASDKNIAVTVFDINGQMVYRNQYYKPNEIIDISVLPSGNYLVRLQQGQEEDTQQIIKK